MGVLFFGPPVSASADQRPALCCRVLQEDKRRKLSNKELAKKLRSGTTSKSS